MYDSQLHTQINTGLRKMKIDVGNNDSLFYTRFVANATAIQSIIPASPRKRSYF